MPKDELDLAKLTEELEAIQIPSAAEGLQILPVSHDQFHARWSLSDENMKRGQMAAARSPDEAQLVLRAFNLSSEPDNNHQSNSWNDFNVHGADGSGYFTMPASTPRVGASLGLVNRSGRFTPVEGCEPVHLPAPPNAPPPSNEDTAEDSVQDDPTENRAAETPETAPHSKSNTQVSVTHRLSEKEITDRIADLHGLPKALAELPQESRTEWKQQANDILDTTDALSSSSCLDEFSVLTRVRERLAEEPSPTIEPSSETAVRPAGNGEGPQTSVSALDQNTPQLGSTADSSQESPPTEPAGASESLASQWEALWSEKAPISIRATFVLKGRIANGMSLLLGHEIIEPLPGGVLHWERELETFDQAWSLIQIAMSTPSVSTSPTLEFWADKRKEDTLLDLHASLEISGIVLDPAYSDKLPKPLKIDHQGHFKASSQIPHGAVILPGLCLVGK